MGEEGRPFFLQNKSETRGEGTSFFLQKKIKQGAAPFPDWILDKKQKHQKCLNEASHFGLFYYKTKEAKKVNEIRDVTGHFLWENCGEC